MLSGVEELTSEKIRNLLVIKGKCRNCHRPVNDELKKREDSKYYYCDSCKLSHRKVNEFIKWCY